MQPLFEASGWSLPTTIAAQPEEIVSKSKKDGQTTQESKITKEADRLQAQIAQLNQPSKAKQAKNKKRTLQQAELSTEKQTKKAKPEQKAEKKGNSKQNVSAKDTAQRKQALEDKKKKVTKNNTEDVQQQHQNSKQKPKEKKLLNAQQKGKLQALLAKNKPDLEPKPEPVSSDKHASGLTPLQQKMKEKLSGARFRWLNEQLYTTKGDQSFQLFQEKPELFDEYHEGFRHQVESWPVNPVDVIVNQLRKKPKGTIIIDLGCGDAKIAHTLKKQKVLSYDMVAKNDKLPLESNSVDVAVFSLSLMGTNYLDFLKEAHRVLKVGGELKIAEVVSRFSDVDSFVDLLERLGFAFVSKEDDNKMFIMLYFTKQDQGGVDDQDDEILEGLSKSQKRAIQKGAGVRSSTGQLQKTAQKLLKPCVYKKR